MPTIASSQPDTGPAGRAPAVGREVLAAAVAYAALTLLATWPVARSFADHVPGGDWWGSRRLYSEAPVNLWNLWWFRHALVDLGQTPFTCRYLFYPFGADLVLHTLAPLHGAVALPLQRVLPLAAVQNTLLILDFVAGGTLTFALGRRLGLRADAAFLAGAIFAFAPAIFAHLWVGHYELVAAFWLPAVLLLFLHVVESASPGPGAAVALGSVWAASAYSSFYYALYGVELLVAVAALRWRRVFRRAALPWLALSAFVGLAGVGPLAAALAHRQAALERSAPQDLEAYSGDLFGALVPSFTHPLLGPLLRPLHERLNSVPPGLPQETTIYLGLSAIGLALFGLSRRDGAWPHGRWLAGIVGIFWVLSLGSRLKLLGAVTAIPLPAALLGGLPLAAGARASGRHIVVAMLALGLLAGWGWQALRRPVARAAVLALLGFEYLAVPLPMFSTAVPDVYRRLAALTEKFAVLELPYGVRDGSGQLGKPDSAQIFAQTFHEHPTTAGMVSRLPMRTWEEIASAPVLGTLLHPRGATRVAFERDLRLGPEFFARWHIAAILVHPPARGGAEQAYLERVLPIRGRESFSDGSELLWVGVP